MRKIIASAALIGLGIAAAGPALAGEGGCGWSSQTVQTSSPMPTQTAETPRPATDQTGG